MATRKKKPATKRKPAKKRAASKRPSRGRKPTARGRKGAARPSLAVRARRFVVRITVASGLGVVIGTGAVGAVLLHDARGTVRDKLAAQVWEVPGQVWSGPVSVWPGLTATPEELARDLRGAGYVQVDALGGPGDFVVHPDALQVRLRATNGPGWRVEDTEALVTFAGGRVASVSPAAPLVLPATQLASVRGPSNEERTPRTLDDFPEHLQQAVLAMEDDDFWTHRGIAPLGIARALLQNALAGRTISGGSTLTQQLAKNLFLSPERTWRRKLDELFLALALEQELDKEAILTLYMNEIYWGQLGGRAICGADQAARTFFGKPVERLDIGEAATLAGIISSPNAYNPLRHPERATSRRNLALGRMVELGWLGADEAAVASRSPLEAAPVVSGRVAPYAVDAAVEAAEAALGEAVVSREGLVLHTGLHPRLQALAERAVAQGLAELEGAVDGVAGIQAALVAVDVHTGAVLAMVGGRDYGHSQYNRALYAERQPGSTVKPLTMLWAFEHDEGLSPHTRFIDEPIERTLDGTTWAPKNYDGSYEGEVRLREVIARSRNVPAVLLAEELGYARLQDGLQALGLAGATRLPSAALGAFSATPVELAGAYTVFGGMGTWAAPTHLSAVYDVDGAQLIRDEPLVLRRTSERAAWLATDVLGSVMTEGTGAKAASYGVTGAVGGKTGTTDAGRDAWFAGVTDDLAVVVWVGFDDNRATRLTGSKAALPIWARFVAASGTADATFPMPSSVVEAEVCLGEWTLGVCDSCGTEVFSKGEEPARGCGLDDSVLSILDRLVARTPVNEAGDDERTGPGAWLRKRRRNR